MQNKTLKTSENVTDFLNKISDNQMRQDCLEIHKLMETTTGETGAMWGTSIVGFGTYHYKYESGREGDFLCVGFSPRKQNITLYILGGFSAYENLLKNLGKFKTGKSCLYIRKLADINIEILKDIVARSYQYIKNKKW